jgi:hypothetical protein
MDHLGGAALTATALAWIECSGFGQASAEAKSDSRSHGHVVI